MCLCVQHQQSKQWFLCRGREVQLCSSVRTDLCLQVCLRAWTIYHQCVYICGMHTDGCFALCPQSQSPMWPSLWAARTCWSSAVPSACPAPPRDKTSLSSGWTAPPRSQPATEFRSQMEAPPSLWSTWPAMIRDRSDVMYLILSVTAPVIHSNSPSAVSHHLFFRFLYR